MAESIKSIFDRECGHIAFDRKFHKKVRDFGQGFVNKNDDNVNFFGSNLLGVYPVRWYSTDTSTWWDDVMLADDVTIRQEVVSLPSIPEHWVRGTDATNLSCLWACHMFFNSDLPTKQKEEAMVDVLMVLHYKLISSLMAHYFRYPADKATAVATYAALSKKFAIKVHGSWYALLEARCRDIIDRKSIHFRTIQTFDDDAEIQSMITDVQGRLRGIMKKMWAVFDQVRTQDAKIVSTAGLVELDGDSVVRDLTRNYTPYKNYIHAVAQDRTRFIKDDLLHITSTAMHTMPEKLLKDALEYIVENYGSRGNEHVEEFIEETLLHAFEFLGSDKSDFSRSGDLATLITKLRSIYMSSRSRDPSLLKMRKLGERIVKKSVKSRNSSTIAAVRTGMMLYIVLRAFTKSHYG